MNTGKLKVGIIGCGNISAIYMKNLKTFSSVELVACADRVQERARERAEEFGVACRSEPEGLLEDPGIDLILNLTTPDAHGEIGLRTVRAGRHLYNEKPLAVELDEARALLREAEARGLRVGCAPDTVLGAGIARCRALIDGGAIGRPLAGTAFFVCPGHESWHPDPDFYYKRGGGPLFDMGPYYLSALITLLGPVRRVTGSSQRGHNERTIGSGPRRGERIDVEVATHVAGVLDFVSGPVVSFLMSFDVHAAQLPRIEIYGSEGSVSVPDPNTFGGPVSLFKSDRGAWAEEALVEGYDQESRGLGVAEMACAIAEGRPHRVSGEVALHVLEIMHAVHRASERSCHVDLETTCTQPESLSADWRA